MCVTPACQYVWAMIHFFKKVNSVTMSESFFIPAGHPRRRRRVAYGATLCRRMGRPSVDDPCTPRAERPPRQPHTLSVTVVGCSMGIWARTLRVDRGMDGFRGPSGAHFMVCSLLVLGPKYQILPSRHFCVIETPEKRNAWVRNG